MHLIVSVGGATYLCMPKGGLSKHELDRTKWPVLRKRAMYFSKLIICVIRVSGKHRTGPRACVGCASSARHSVRSCSQRRHCFGGAIPRPRSQSLSKKYTSMRTTPQIRSYKRCMQRFYRAQKIAKEVCTPAIPASLIAFTRAPESEHRY